jgi:dTDP-4-amino-4,6-dideoxygalactose transaminase
VRIPLVDLRGQYRALRPQMEAAIGQVLESGQFALGPSVEAFERAFGAYCGTSEAVAVNSGTSALHIALLAAGIRPGDEVITSPFTFVASVAAIEYAGAKPVFVDIEPNSYTMDPAALERAVTPRTKAVIPVHLYGQPAEMDPILACARRHGLVVIEDACQAHGADHNGRRAGSLGDIGCFSFYPGKNLGAYGEGGAAVTNNPQFAETMRLLRSWGERTRYEHAVRGFNYRMDGIQGAVLGVKLQYLDQWNDARRRTAAAYTERLAGLDIGTPIERRGARHVYHLYVVRLAHRDLWRARLTELGIQCGVHYPVPVHLQPAYRDLGYQAGDFPVAEHAAAEVLSLPMFPEMTEQQVDEVTGALRAGLPTSGRVTA